MAKLKRMLASGAISRGALAGVNPHYVDNGRVDHEPGAISADHINDPAHTSAGSRARASGKPSSTVYGRESAPGPNQLNDPRYHKKKYPGHWITGKGNPRGPMQSEKRGYPMQKRPPYYGGGPGTH